MATDIRHQPENGYHSEPTQPSLKENLNSRSPMRLPRTLSPLETWGFGMTGLIAGVTVAPAMHVAIGPNAIFVWLPAVLVGVMLNLQVKRLGEHWPEISGGTPNYITRLLSNYPLLARYTAIAYFFGWAVYPSVNAIVITALIKANLEPLGIACPETVLRIGFTIIAYIVAFSGTRALGILHSFFIFPAVGFLLVFSIQGMGWLAFSPESPGLFPSSWPTLTFVNWAKWSFLGIYITCGCETASSFVADSRRPTETLRVLNLTAWLIPPVFLGSSWVLMRLATSPGLGDDSFKNLLAAASPFWGQSASLIVTLLLASSALLASATGVSNSPRILYQLALDGHVSPFFAFISRRGVLEPALVFSLLISLIGLLWGDVTRISVVGSASYLITMMALYLGLWLQRGSPEVRWPWWAAGFFVLDAVVLMVGGLNWSWQDVTLGFLLPVAILAVDAAIRRISFAPFHRAWWIRHYRARRKSQIVDFVAFQVIVLILLVCSAVSIGWVFRSQLDANSTVGSNLLAVLILTVTFVGVAVACWTSLPQVVSMDEAREAAEQLFVIAIDAIVVLDENGMIRQANPASERLFELSRGELSGSHLNKLLPGLAFQPERWPIRSEHTLNLPVGVLAEPLRHRDSRILEVAISNRFSQEASLSNQELQEYVAIVRDITERKQAQEALQTANEELEIKVKERTSELSQTVEQLQNEVEERQRIEENLKAMQNQIVVQEKLASLGSLTAGIAHEIRNPLNFVNNFSELSAELTQELFEELGNQGERLAPETNEYIAELLTDLKANLTKINQHGQRADKIVGNMLLHSRGQSGHWEATDINSLLAEYINLAYHGMRAKEAGFNITIETDYDNDIEEIEVVPQDIGRVFLNIISNACYAAYKKKQEMGEVFSPVLDVRTRNLRDAIEIRIRDNGSGIKPEVLDKIFNPFFTTKPPAEGTGLGLSISQDVIVQQHRGELKVETEVGNYTEFIILLPRKNSQS
jgi:PAS domain S-box-containing protein